MGLKQLIKEQQILASGVVDAELVLPGEPLIYSIKYSIGSRKHSVQFFRDQKWKSLLKCYFRSYLKTHVPVVVLVRFYVSPPSYVDIKPAELKKESLPAVHSFEVCDYLLSFLEMLHHVLINSYRQVVKVDVEKFYSSSPRTVLKFMKWDQYVKLQDRHSIHSQSEELCAAREVQPVQPKRKRHAPKQRIREELPQGAAATTHDRPAAADSALQNPGSIKSTWEKTPTATLLATHQKTRWRQSR